jgi:hypothetical protein
MTSRVKVPYCTFTKVKVDSGVFTLAAAYTEFWGDFYFMSYVQVYVLFYASMKRKPDLLESRILNSVINRSSLEAMRQNAQPQHLISSSKPGFNHPSLGRSHQPRSRSSTLVKDHHAKHRKG